MRTRIFCVFDLCAVFDSGGLVWGDDLISAAGVRTAGRIEPGGGGAHLSGAR